MVAKAGLSKFVLFGLLILAAGTGNAQDELRKTFFKDADAAKASAESTNAGILIEYCMPVYHFSTLGGW